MQRGIVEASISSERPFADISRWVQPSIPRVIPRARIQKGPAPHRFGYFRWHHETCQIGQCL
ncbi:hypothetical protein RSSM_03490 [Rhodopirellula sallentina SM41]|uniref:Uncharacterized protein n=1 Tax=Rhodopirellula sallentina SM41 TaxID=1263870 RepID=M5U0U2_9BACT|nr:hypothetical protein RSSM_03490 [Rhodopirellula sallentina SM41]